MNALCLTFNVDLDAEELKNTAAVTAQLRAQTESVKEQLASLVERSALQGRTHVRVFNSYLAARTARAVNQAGPAEISTGALSEIPGLPPDPTGPLWQLGFTPRASSSSDYFTESARSICAEVTESKTPLSHSALKDPFVFEKDNDERWGGFQGAGVSHDGVEDLSAWSDAGESSAGSSCKYRKQLQVQEEVASTGSGCKCEQWDVGSGFSDGGGERAWGEGEWQDTAYNTRDREDDSILGSLSLQSNGDAKGLFKSMIAAMHGLQHELIRRTVRIEAIESSLSRISEVFFVAYDIQLV
jgi:hypothetical protein